MYCINCGSCDIDIIGGLEDEGEGNLRDDYKCNECNFMLDSDDFSEYNNFIDSLEII